MDKVKVSIITPVYNSSLYIEKCLNSTLNQTYTNIEHIIVDDCSTDDSVNIVEKYIAKDSRVKLIKLQKNSGAGVARNTAIKLAKGRFIAFLDADDSWHIDKLECQINFMIKNQYQLSYTGYYVVNEKGDKLFRRLVPEITSYSDILKNCYLFCSTVVYDTKTIGKMYMPIIRKRQDWVLWIRILDKIENSYGINEPLVNYMQGNESLSKNKFKLIKYNFNVYRKELKKSYIRSCLMMVNFLAHYFYYKKASMRKI